MARECFSFCGYVYGMAKLIDDCGVGPAARMRMLGSGLSALPIEKRG